MYSINQFIPKTAASIARTVCLASIPVLMAACATGPAPAESIRTDPSGVLAKDFTVSYVNPALRTKLVAVGLPEHKKYKEIKIKFSQHLRRLGDTEDKIAYPEVTYRPLEDRYFQEIWDINNNGFLASRVLVLSWAGLIDAKRDQVSANDRFSRAGFDLKDIKPFKFNPAQMSTGDKVTYEYEFGARPQGFNFNSAKSSCVVQKKAAASEINKNIEGSAVWFDCDLTYSQSSPGRGKIVFLVDYGLAINAESAFADNSNRFEVKEFTVK